MTWTGDLQFAAVSGAAAVTLDGSGKAGPSPVQALAFALAGCMAADLVHILGKGHHPLRALRARLTAHRAQEDPHRFVQVELEFAIEGAVPVEAIERAIALSRDKYCSVWHSLRTDIDFTVTFRP